MSDGHVYIIDYGLGNVGSVLKACEFLGYSPEILEPNNLSQLDFAGTFILPGAGQFDSASKILLPYKDPLFGRIEECGGHLIGICLGMQIFMASGGEKGASIKGLGIIPGEMKSFNDISQGEILQNIGWREVSSSGAQCQAKFIWNGRVITVDGEYYFMHAWFVDCLPRYIVGISDSGGVSVPAVIKRGNFVGLQFHPEKSGVSGLRLLEQLLKR